MTRERQFSPLFILVAIIAVVAALFLAKQILLPISLSFLLSFLLTPIVNRFEHFGLPRLPAVILVVLLAFTMMGLLGWVVTDQIVGLRNEVSSHRTRILAKAQAFKRFTRVFERVGEEITGGDEEDTKGKASESKKGDEPVEPTDKVAATGVQPSPDPPGEGTETGEIESPTERAATGAVENVAETGSPLPMRRTDAIPVKVVEMPPSPLTQAQLVLGTLAAPLTTLGMVIVLVFFVLLDHENQRNRIIQLFGTSNIHTTTAALHDATHRVGRYLRMQFLINAGYGVAVAVGLYFFGIPSAIMWGVLGFTLRFLPYLGPWLAAVLPILVSLAVSDGWTTPILVACMYAVYELILNNVAEPMLYGSSTGVSTVGVIISAIFWTWLWGPIGLILAMPMTVCLVVMARHVPQLRFITVLLADQATLSPAQRVYQRLLAYDYDEPLKLAHQHLKSAPLVTFYEDVLIPALSLAECDRQDGVLSEEQESFVREAAEDLVEELGASDFAAHTADDAEDGSSVEPTRKIREAPATRVLCIPLQDAADETTSRMLAQLLVADGFEVDSSPAGTLTSEMVDRVAASDSNIVVISILPPIRPRDSRLLWKRLRTRYPHLPIVVGYWVGPNATESLLPPRGDETSRVATSLSDAVALVRSTAAKLESTKAVPA